MAHAGIISLKGINANANRAASADKALQEQAPGSESNFSTPADVEQSLARLDEIRTELGECSNKLYGSMMSPMMGNMYSGPVYTQRLAIQREMDLLQREQSSLEARIAEMLWVLPPYDGGEDEEENEDPTQPDPEAGE